MSGARATNRRVRWPYLVTLALGIGLILAPVAFAMFDRAPKGADMIDAFRPYMTEAKIRGFQHDMATIDRGVTEAKEQLNPRLSGATLDTSFASYGSLLDEWPAINADMTDMLATMRRDIPKFEAVDALPNFVLFPWFFVIPGLLVIGASAWGLTRGGNSRGGNSRGPTIALVALGVGLIAAPAVFLMFTRAPKGGEMINDFRPLMTTQKVQTIQGYFLTIGAGEGTLRNEVLPALSLPTATPPALDALRAVERFEAQWPGISNRMAPMIGAMSDNVANYEAVDALPSFPLFPWFFVIPGVLIAGFALAGARRAGRAVAETGPPGPAVDGTPTHD